MFKWFKGRQTGASAPAKLAAADVSKIIQQYGAGKRAQAEAERDLIEMRAFTRGN